MISRTGNQRASPNFEPTQEGIKSYPKTVEKAILHSEDQELTNMKVYLKNGVLTPYKKEKDDYGNLKIVKGLGTKGLTHIGKILNKKIDDGTFVLSELVFSDISDVFWVDISNQFFGKDQDIKQKLKEKCKNYIIQIAKTKNEIARFEKMLEDVNVTKKVAEETKEHIKRLANMNRNLRVKLDELFEYEIVQADEIEDMLLNRASPQRKDKNQTGFSEASLEFTETNTQSGSFEDDEEMIEKRKLFRAAVDEKGRKARKIIGVSIVDAKAMTNRTSAESLSDFVEIYREYEKKGGLSDFEGVLQAALCSRQKAAHVLSVFARLSFIEAEQNSTLGGKSINDVEQEYLAGNGEIKDTVMSLKNSRDNIYLYIPFWSTPFCGETERCVALRKIIGFSLQEISLLEKMSSQYTIGDYVDYYRNNRATKKFGLFSPEEVIKMENLGLTRSRTESFIGKIVTIATESLVVPSFMWKFTKINENVETLSIRDIRGFTVEMLLGVLAGITGTKNKTKRIFLDHLDLPSSFVDALQTVIVNSSEIFELNFTNNRLQDGGLHRLAQTLKGKSLHKLLVLVLDNCLLGHAAIPSFSMILKEPTKPSEKYPELQVLSLSTNALGNGGAEGLGHLLANNSSMRLLDISGNNIDDRGVISLLESIRTNSTLEVLYCSQNNLTGSSLMKIERILKNMGKDSKLSILKLGIFEISEEAAKRFYDILQEVPSLEFFEVNHYEKNNPKASQKSSLSFSQNRSAVFSLVQGAPPLQDPNVNVKNVISGLLVSSKVSLDDILVGAHAASLEKNEMRNKGFYKFTGMNQTTQGLQLDVSISQNNFKGQLNQMAGVPLTMFSIGPNGIGSQESRIFNREMPPYASSETTRGFLDRVFSYFEDQPENPSFLEVVVYLLKANVLSIKDVLGRGEHLIHFCVRLGHINILRYLVKKNKETIFQVTTLLDREFPLSSPLHYACIYEKQEAFEFLMESNASLDQKDSNGNTPLIYALVNGNVPMIRQILQMNQNISVPNKRGFLPIHMGVFSNDQEAFELIAKATAEAQNTSLELALSRKSEKTECTPLMIAVEVKAFNIVEYLLKTGVNLNDQNSQGKTALMIAIANQNDRSALMILEKQPDVSITDKFGENALFIACKTGKLDLIKVHWHFIASSFLNRAILFKGE